MMNLKRNYAPWNLKGNGYIILYKLPVHFLKEEIHIPEFFKDKLYGGLSALMIIDYSSSDVGPYHEILFIPGLFNFNNSKYFSISKIYVDSQESIFNGRENWAIPKEYADFKITDNQKQKIEIANNQTTFFKGDFKSNSFKIPFTSKILPLSLVQHKDKETFITEFFASGYISKAETNIEFIDETYLPDLTGFKPLLSFKISNFNMTFKEAKIFNE